jgi:alpha-L-rhamnosidase
MKKISIIVLLISFVIPAFASLDVSSVRKARPVWAAGREKEMNVNLGFRTVFTAKSGEKAKIRIAASSIYRVFLNGLFVGSGPARAAHGYFRVDEYEFEPKALKEGENIVALEVAGYNVNSFYILDQPSFLLSEVEIDGKIVAATGNKADFEAMVIKERVQKTERYSFQRPFTEYWRMKEGYDLWRTSSERFKEKVKLATFAPVQLLPRNVQMPKYDILRPSTVYARGKVQAVKPEKYHKDRSLKDINERLKGYREDELEVRPPSQEIQEIANASSEIVNKAPAAVSPLELKEKEFFTFDFGTDYSGFLGAKLHCSTATRLCFYFDEMLTDGDVNTRKRMNDVCNQIIYELAPGDYNIETIESYTFKFLKVIALEGDFRIEDIYIREFAYPANTKATFSSNLYKLNQIYAAAKQSSRQNSLDVFMDCASRERAGWLCDSYFASVMEREFTGKADIAYNFLENYALPDSFKFLPKGMIPMCYPADFYNGQFIPNYALWFIVQVDDYAKKGGDPKLIEKLKPRIESLFKFFEGFENEDGLLEHLPSWVFVEWSKANNFVQDVSYPSNMLYSAALKLADRIYGNEAWRKKSEQIRSTILKQSWNGSFFVDNAIRENGKLTVTKNTTEVCQYYAFYFNIATPESHPELWHRLVGEFGPSRDDTKVYPDVYRANAFMGNYMRMDLLARYGLQNQMLIEIQDYFFAMADKTGTLWEHSDNRASCNHGFASYIGHVLYRDILGINNIDYVNKTITIRFSDIPVDNCSGSIPIGNDYVALKWVRDGNSINYSLKSPSGFRIIMENQSKATPKESLSPIIIQ